MDKIDYNHINKKIETSSQMISKNISVRMEKNKNIPFEETYLVFYKNKDKVKLFRKHKNESKNVEISFTVNECERMMNLLNFYLLDGNYEYKKDRMLRLKD